MKHIKRKFLNANKIKFNLNKIPDSSKLDHEKNMNRIGIENIIAWRLTETGYLIQGFMYNDKSSNIFIPAAHPIVIYFNAAQNYLAKVYEYKEKLLIILNDQLSIAENQRDAVYTYFSLATLFTTSLYNSLEAFMNYIIPEKYEYYIKNKKINKQYIQRHSIFKDKIEFIVPLATNKDFVKIFGDKYVVIKGLKEYRDEVMHTKAYSDIHSNPYRKLFVMALDFDYEAAIWAVRDYINFYEVNLIEDCNCGKDH